jgi:hypothetical protein
MAPKKTVQSIEAARRGADAYDRRAGVFSVRLGAILRQLNKLNVDAPIFDITRLLTFFGRDQHLFEPDRDRVLPIVPATS